MGKPKNPMRAAEWVVRPIKHSRAVRFLQQHHYKKGAGNTSVLAAGLFEVGSNTLQGVAVYLPPMRPAARFAATKLKVRPNEVLTLSRLAVAPGVPTNAATYTMARSRRLLDRQWKGLITYADPAEGHTGAIYRADNWRREGEGKAHPTWVDPATGKQVSPRAGPSGRRRNRTYAEMEAAGYQRVEGKPKPRYLKKVR